MLKQDLYRRLQSYDISDLERSTAWFDKKYFSNLCTWIRKSDNIVYDTALFSKEPDKFIRHLLWYHWKNKDLRWISIIDERTDSEKMYGYSHIYFELSDMYGSAEAQERLPEAIKIQREERLMKQIILPSEAELKLLHEFNAKNKPTAPASTVAHNSTSQHGSAQQRNLFDK